MSKGISIFIALSILLLYICMGMVINIDLPRLFEGIPRMIGWAGKSWPPDFTEFPIFLVRAFETLSIATIGTTVAFFIALPIAFLAARNMNSNRFMYHFIRSVLNILRGTDAFVFALIFVAAVGLGPFAGMLGVALHTTGSMAKMFAEWIENQGKESLEALKASGVSKPKMIMYALLPDAWPSFTSISLYFWEFNVRASTVLGIVGAGGIGMELKNSMDLLDFSRLFSILLIIWSMVTIIDRFSASLQRRLQ
jgi:phosphonate transport system permease protein